MNKIPYEVYKAFASTKPTQFDAFMRKWKEPEPEPQPKKRKVKKSAKRARSPKSVPESKKENNI